jgi:hypothetical protein
MVDYTDVFVDSPIKDVKEAVQKVFQINGFTIEWKSEYGGKAKKGSTAMNVAFGAFAQAHEIEFSILTGQDKTVAIRLVKIKSGWTGGLLGKRKVQKQYEKIVQMVSDHFASMGTYKGRK